jgi:hypothetical protein
MAFNTFQNPNRNFGRSLAFSEFLNRQTPEQKRKIVAAERVYLHEVSRPTSLPVAVAGVYADSFKGTISQPLDPAAVM